MESQQRDLLEKIRAGFIDSGRDGRYRLPAYLFLMQGLEYCFATKGEKRHITGQELSRALADFAIKQFGPLARSVLNNWGIHKTDDFGFIVYNLISLEIMSKQDSDSLEDFFDVFDLNENFEKADCFTLDKDHIRRIKHA